MLLLVALVGLLTWGGIELWQRTSGTTRSEPVTQSTPDRQQRASGTEPVLGGETATEADAEPQPKRRRHPRVSPPPPGQSLAGATIVLDPGHNGGNGAHAAEIARKVDAGGFMKECDTTGTQTNDGRLTESVFNLETAQELGGRLMQAGAHVVMTRTDNEGVGPCIDRRAQIGNDAAATLAVSIHADGGPPTGHGFHVIYPASASPAGPAVATASLKLAQLVRARLLDAGLETADYIGTDGLDARSDLGGLNLSRIPKVFVELGNMRNAGDAAQLESPRFRARIADALARASADFVHATTSQR